MHIKKILTDVKIFLMCYRIFVFFVPTKNKNIMVIKQNDMFIYRIRLILYKKKISLHLIVTQTAITKANILNINREKYTLFPKQSQNTSIKNKTHVDQCKSRLFCNTSAVVICVQPLLMSLFPLYIGYCHAYGSSSLLFLLICCLFIHC